MTTLVLPKLELDSMIPPFELPSVNGDVIRLWDFKQKQNLVLVFVHDLNCEPCMHYISEIAKEYSAYQEQEAEVLVIVGSEPSGDLLNQAKKFPFPVLIDKNGQVGDQFLEVDAEGRPLPSVFIVDRFNSLYAGYITENEDELPDNDEILASLSLLEAECPECGV